MPEFFDVRLICDAEDCGAQIQRDWDTLPSGEQYFFAVSDHDGWTQPDLGGRGEVFCPDCSQRLDAWYARERDDPPPVKNWSWDPHPDDPDDVVGYTDSPDED
jgi:hypothetical protein